MSENKLVDNTKVSGLASMLEGLEFVADKPKEKLAIVGVKSTVSKL